MSEQKVVSTRRRLSAPVALAVFLPFALGYFLSYWFRTVNSVIASDLERALDLSPSDVGLLTSTYFLAFALAQLPLGLLLDRFGPRRIEAVLLLLAALGAALFAAAESLQVLTLGRALIGLGMSACLMASFKAFTLWFPPVRLPLVNGLLLMSGGAGAVLATMPLEFALRWLDWRTVFAGLAAAAVSVAFVVWRTVPEYAEKPAHHGLGEQLRGLRDVLRDDVFWRIAPLTASSQGVFLAVQGLWAGPWLRDVAGLSRGEAAAGLSLLALALVGGFLASGVLAERLSRRGVSTSRVAGAGMAAFLVVQVMLVSVSAEAWLPLWLAFGFFGASGTLSYAALAQAFSRHLAGRVHTALNLMVFASAFFVQWLMGVVIEHWDPPHTVGYAVSGYDAAIVMVVALQLVAMIWYLKPAGRRND